MASGGVDGGRPPGALCVFEAGLWECPGTAPTAQCEPGAAVRRRNSESITEEGRGPQIGSRIGGAVRRGRGLRQLTGCGCSSRSEPARACGRLAAQTAMRAAVVIADVLAQDALGVALAEDEDVIEAVATECPHQALADRVGQRRSGRREKTPHPEAVESPAETR